MPLPSAPAIPKVPAALALLALSLLLPASALARAFDSRTLSDTNSFARSPLIADSGVICWTEHTAATPENAADSSVVVTRSDVFVSDNGAAPVNITGEDPLVAGRVSNPFPDGRAVIYACNTATNAPSGPQFHLAQPELTEDMLQMSSEYPSLFGLDAPPPATEQTLADETGQPAPDAANAADAPDAEQPAEPAEPAGPRKPSARPRSRFGDGLTIAFHTIDDNNTSILTPHPYGFSHPVLTGNCAAFLVSRTWPYGYELVSADLTDPSAPVLTQLTTNFFYVSTPSVSSNFLAFQAWDGNDYEIYLHDFATHTTTQLSENTFDDTDPVIHADTIAWIGHPLVTPEIFTYDIPSATLRKLSTSSTTHNTHPSTWGNKVVWQALDDEGNDTEIYYFDGNRIIKLTSNVWDDTNPVIRDNLIAWSSYVELGDAEIMVLDLADNIPVQLTDDAADDLFPATAKGMVVWQADTDDGHSAICIATPHQD